MGMYCWERELELLFPLMALGLLNFMLLSYFQGWKLLFGSIQRQINIQMQKKKKNRDRIWQLVIMAHDQWICFIIEADTQEMSPMTHWQCLWVSLRGTSIITYTHTQSRRQKHLMPDSIRVFIPFWIAANRETVLCECWMYCRTTYSIHGYRRCVHACIYEIL